MRDSTNGRSAVRRRQSSGVAGRFTVGGLAGEFGDEGLHLVDRSNAASLKTGEGPGCPFPPHGSDRRGVHPHGKIYTGSFESTGNAADLSDSPQLARDATIEAVVRTSNFLHPLDQPDVMGLAVKLESETGGTWDLIATSAPTFVVPSMAGFRSVNLLATHKVLRPAWLRLFLRSLLNRMSLKALFELRKARGRKRIERITSTYWGVHTFRLTRAERDDADAIEHAFRFRWVPVEQPDPDTAIFDLWFDIIRPDWPHMNAATKSPKPEDIERSVHAGRLTIAGQGANWDADEDDPGDEVLFLPTRLPHGVGATDDELLFARGAAYQLSYLRRTEGR